MYISILDGFMNTREKANQESFKALRMKHFLTNGIFRPVLTAMFILVMIGITDGMLVPVF